MWLGNLVWSGQDSEANQLGQIKTCDTLVVIQTEPTLAWPCFLIRSVVLDIEYCFLGMEEDVEEIKYELWTKPIVSSIVFYNIAQYRLAHLHGLSQILIVLLEDKCFLIRKLSSEWNLKF